MQPAVKAYLLSVSLVTGCYRHLKIDADTTLETLSDAILDAFNFDNDHAHAFFMDNRAWSDADSYFMAMDEDYDDERPYTCEHTLRGAGLVAGKKFVYVFDFGDDWRFQCRVLKELEKAAPEPEIVRSVGEPPTQYTIGDWDEEEDAGKD